MMQRYLGRSSLQNLISVHASFYGLANFEWYVGSIMAKSSAKSSLATTARLCGADVERHGYCVGKGSCPTTVKSAYPPEWNAMTQLRLSQAMVFWLG